MSKLINKEITKLVRINSELHRILKIIAAHDSKTLKELAEDQLFELYLQRRRQFSSPTTSSNSSDYINPNDLPQHLKKYTEDKFIEKIEKQLASNRELKDENK